MPPMTASLPTASLPLDAESIHALAARSMFELFSSISEGMFLIDRSGRIVWVNDSYQRFLPALGLGSVQDFVGQMVEDAIPGTQMRRVLETGKPELIDLLTNRAGTFVVSRIPLRDEGGSVIGAIGIVFFDHPETTLRPLISKFAQMQRDLDDARRELAAQRSQYDELTARLRASDERRMQGEHTLEPLRQRITELQLKEQAARLGLEQYDSLLTDAQADLQALAQSVAEGNVRLAGLQGEIDRLQREIAALGAVNLAALEELGLARERKGFLDAQMQDLTLAMTTLEDAIRKIDGETRSLLSGTFEAVNDHFGRMFPELFGGGQARLTMTGEEILDSGVQVMAQPPGKKNQTIHLLSGGEKALTAIALVFAIFQLNPAPFCLLDEVDAPLDDANTERYARLVASMSRGTQFLFISHNKIAMEMAEQLIGVTMQEQGVSRIVAVDMESALSMAEA